ncbi:beta-lactamase hydrolase domain-containing protein [Alteraurantiacibacter buctensis]|nr:sulfur transferase domain-containing protein [Alteraurantiacibacter buctensis]
MRGISTSLDVNGGGTMTDPADIRAFLRLSPTLTTSGRLQPGDPARLAAMGVAHVINLAMPDHPEALPDAAAEIAAARLGYTHIPVPFDAPTLEHYRAFATALEAAETPVHVHCIMNWRVSAFLCRWHRERGMADDAARAQMQLVWDPESSDYPHADKWAAIALG